MYILFQFSKTDNIHALVPSNYYKYLFLFNLIGSARELIKKLINYITNHSI